MFDNKAFIAFIEDARSQTLDLVCVNILDTQGSSYQKSGAMMLINSASEMVGVISNGCLEAKIKECAKEVLSSKKGKIELFDLRLVDDSLQSWQEGIGCNGAIRIWIEPFYFESAYGALGEALNAPHQTLVRSTKQSGEYQILDEAIDTHYDEEQELFYQAIELPFALLILGQGVGVEPLQTIAHTLGWQVTITQEIEEINLNHFDASVIMSHDFKQDALFLQTLLSSTLNYIGVMGSKKRTQKLLEAIGEQSNSRIYAPIGLDLGGDSPASIALAICAEIKTVRYGKTQYSLRDKNRPIHGN
ncbi:MAG: XdhC family protein [Campylobacterales bacterium]|nr:XdhC family protein [Campylobacterales bacterium]